jgi:hypothetical protein
MPDSDRMKRNLQVTFDLHEAGILMMRQNIRRKFPEASDTEINRRLQAWLEERPLLGEIVETQSQIEARRDLAS